MIVLFVKFLDSTEWLMIRYIIQIKWKRWYRKETEMKTKKITLNHFREKYIQKWII